MKQSSVPVVSDVVVFYIPVASFVCSISVCMAGDLKSVCSLLSQSTVYSACMFCVRIFFSALVIRENNNNTYQLEVRYVHIILWMRSTLLNFFLNFFSSFHAVLEHWDCCCCCCCRCRLVSSTHMLSYWVHYCTLYHSLFRFAIFAQYIRMHFSFFRTFLEFSFQTAMILICFTVVAVLFTEAVHLSLLHGFLSPLLMLNFQEFTLCDLVTFLNSSWVNGRDVMKMMSWGLFVTLFESCITWIEKYISIFAPFISNMNLIIFLPSMLNAP